MHEFDLVIVGTGSGNSIPGPEFDDWTIAIVEKGVFGGTCLNVGCIPSKMFVYAADVAETVRHASKFGIDAQVNSVDWPAMRHEKSSPRSTPDMAEAMDPLAEPRSKPSRFAVITTARC